jgi:hypothetical protein
MMNVAIRRVNTSGQANPALFAQRLYWWPQCGRGLTPHSGIPHLEFATHNMSVE